MTKLAIYLFGYDNAQTIPTRTLDGRSWYMAARICELLGIVGYSTAVNRERQTDDLTLEECERRHESIHIGGYGKKQVLLVNNGGMLKLIYQGSTSFAAEVRERVQNIPERLIPPEWADYMIDAE